MRARRLLRIALATSTLVTFGLSAPGHAASPK